MTEVEPLKAITTQDETQLDPEVLKNYYELMYHTACRYIEMNGVWDDFYDNYIEGKQFL